MFGFPRVHAAPTRARLFARHPPPRDLPSAASCVSIHERGSGPVPPGMTGKNLAETLARVASASTRAARARPARLVAVSKTKPVAQLMECYDAGHRDFGENYVQERILEKSPAMPADVNWRFIGHLQSNKVRPLIRGVPSLAVIETVDTVKLANRLDTQVAEAVADAIRAEPLGVMVQVNTSGGEQERRGTRHAGGGPRQTHRRGVRESSLSRVDDHRHAGLHLTPGELRGAPKVQGRGVRSVGRRPGGGGALDGDERRLRGSDRDGKRLREGGIEHLRARDYSKK